MMSLRLPILVMAISLGGQLAHAMDYRFNCHGEVCGGSGPYSECGNARVTIHQDDNLIEGFVGVNAFVADIVALSVKEKQGKLTAKASGEISGKFSGGTVRFKTFPIPTATIKGFGFRETVEIACRVYRFDPQLISKP